MIHFFFKCSIFFFKIVPGDTPAFDHSAGNSFGYSHDFGAQATPRNVTSLEKVCFCFFYIQVSFYFSRFFVFATQTHLGILPNIFLSFLDLPI